MLRLRDTRSRARNDKNQRLGRLLVEFDATTMSIALQTPPARTETRTREEMNGRTVATSLRPLRRDQSHQALTLRALPVGYGR